MGIEDLIKELGALSYVGIFFISLISNIFIPVPEEVVVLVLGYLAGGPHFELLILLPIVLLGLLTSDIAMYFLSKKGNKIITAFYNKVFAGRLASRTEWLRTHIDKVIFFSRFLVQLRFLGPFLAGQMNVPFKRFLIIDLAALLIYVPLYLMAGFYFRSRLLFIIDGIGTVKNIIISLVLFALLVSISRAVYKYLLRENAKFEKAKNE